MSVELVITERASGRACATSARRRRGTSRRGGVQAVATSGTMCGGEQARRRQRARPREQKTTTMSVELVIVERAAALVRPRRSGDEEHLGGEGMKPPPPAGQGAAASELAGVDKCGRRARVDACRRQGDGRGDGRCSSRGRARAGTPPRRGGCRRLRTGDERFLQRRARDKLHCKHSHHHLRLWANCDPTTGLTDRGRGLSHEGSAIGDSLDSPCHPPRIAYLQTFQDSRSIITGKASREDGGEWGHCVMPNHCNFFQLDTTIKWRS